MRLRENLTRLGPGGTGVLCCFHGPPRNQGTSVPEIFFQLEDNAAEPLRLARTLLLRKRKAMVWCFGIMTSQKKAGIFALLATLGVFLGACSTNTPKQSSIPWSQPASWEGQIPGMAQPAGR